MGVVAECDRSMIHERVKSSLARAKADGTKLGRPKVAGTTEAAIKATRAEGKDIQRIAKELGVGSSVVQRVLGAVAKAAWRDRARASLSFLALVRRSVFLRLCDGKL